MGFSLWLGSVLLSSCNFYQLDTRKPTLYTYSKLAEQPRDSNHTVVVKLLEQLKKPLLSGKLEFATGWSMIYGDSSESINGDPWIETQHSLEVKLPHHVLRPNSSILYFRDINFSEDGILSIDADDGAQLFINGQRIKRLKGAHFPVDSGLVKVAIRVLNNAMEGGLRKVTFSTSLQFREYQRAYQLYGQLKLMGEKILLLRDPDITMINSVVRALSTTDTLLVSQVMERLDDYPVLFPYLIRKNEDSLQIQVLCDTYEPVNLTLWKENEIKETYRMNGPLAIFKISLRDSVSFQYQLSSLRNSSEIYTVQSRAEENRCTFNIWADSQGGWNTFLQHMQNPFLQADAFSIGVGDLVANGSDSLQWTELIKVLSVSASLRPYYLIPGNHDYDGYYDDLIPDLYRKFVPQAPAGYYSWRFNNAAFIALDPNETFPIGVKRGTRQYAWFLQQINSQPWRTADWRFVLVHQPPYSQGWPGYHGDKAIRDLLNPVIESAKIDFVICGHTHDYERLTKQYGTQRMTFLVTGGGGGTVEPPGELSTVPVMDTVIKQHHLVQLTIRNDRVLLYAFDSRHGLIDLLYIVK
mgnify:CR=1 FL=1